MIGTYSSGKKINTKDEFAVVEGGLGCNQLCYRLCFQGSCLGTLCLLGSNWGQLGTRYSDVFSPAQYLMASEDKTLLRGISNSLCVCMFVCV